MQSQFQLRDSNPDLRFQSEDDTTTQKGLWPESAEESPPSLHSSPFFWRGDLCGVIPSTTVLFHFKQVCIYTTEDTIVCDEICIHTNKLQHGFFPTPSSPIGVWSQFQLRDSNLGPPIPKRRRYHYTKGPLTRKCGRITPHPPPHCLEESFFRVNFQAQANYGQCPKFTCYMPVTCQRE